MRWSKFIVVMGIAALAALGKHAAAFTHIVQRTETLAQIAERTYGRIQYESILVAANALDAQGGSPIVAGQRLEIPALDHRVVNAGDTWPALALALLGDSDRATVFARANGSMPWIPPPEGAEIVVPYNLRYIAMEKDNIVTIAQKFTEKEKAWMLDQYNKLKGQPIRRGDEVLIPLTNLPLTDAGRAEAAAADAATRTQAHGAMREAQRRVDLDMPVLLADVRGGRYVDAVTRGGRLLGMGELAKAQLGLIQRQLTEAYAALEAPGLAAAACAAWRENDPKARLDPVMLSPKIMSACTKGQP